MLIYRKPFAIEAHRMLWWLLPKSSMRERSLDFTLFRQEQWLINKFPRFEKYCNRPKFWCRLKPSFHLFSVYLNVVRCCTISLKRVIADSTKFQFQKSRTYSSFKELINYTHTILEMVDRFFWPVVILSVRLRKISLQITI